MGLDRLEIVLGLGRDIINGLLPGLGGLVDALAVGQVLAVGQLLFEFVLDSMLVEML